MVNSCWNHFMDMLLLLLSLLLLLLLRDQNKVSEGVPKHDVVEGTDRANATMTGGGTVKLEQINGKRRLDDERKIAKQSRFPLNFMTVVGNHPTEPRHKETNQSTTLQLALLAVCVRTVEV
jgi:hypothetical protein